MSSNMNNNSHSISVLSLLIFSNYDNCGIIQAIFGLMYIICLYVGYWRVVKLEIRRYTLVIILLSI